MCFCMYVIPSVVNCNERAFGGMEKISEKVMVSEWGRGGLGMVVLGLTKKWIHIEMFHHVCSHILIYIGILLTLVTLLLPTHLSDVGLIKQRTCTQYNIKGDISNLIYFKIFLNILKILNHKVLRITMRITENHIVFEVDLQLT